MNLIVSLFMNEKDKKKRPQYASWNYSCFYLFPLCHYFSWYYSLLSVGEVGGEPRDGPWFKYALGAELCEEVAMVDEVEGFCKVQEDFVQIVALHETWRDKI